MFERFVAKIQYVNGCWLWTASVDHGGYGRFTVFGKTVAAHRIVWELLVGPIPEGFTIDHLCRVHRCVNPAHLEPVTPRQNTLRGVGLAAQFSKRTHCKNGHMFTGLTEGGARRCRTCKNKTMQLIRGRVRATEKRA